MATAPASVERPQTPAAPRSIIEPHSLAESVWAHLFPGVLAFLLYAPAARLAGRAGLPPAFALFVAMLVVLIPYELGALARARRKTRVSRVRDLIPYTRRLSALEYAALVPPLLGWAFFGFFVIGPREEGFLSRLLFPFPPEWLIGSTSGAASKAAWIATLAFGVVVNGLAVPVVEELYFRGYLLPRIPCSSRWSPLLNAALFSLYHVFSPWQNLTRVLAVAPIAYVVAWKRSVFVGIATHCLLNTIAMSLALVPLLR